MKGCSSGNNWQYIRRETLQSYSKLLHYHQEAGQVHLLPWRSGPNTIFYENNTYFLKIADHHLLPRSPKIECINGPLVAYVKNINGTYFLILDNSTITPCFLLMILSPSGHTFKLLEFMITTTRCWLIPPTSWNLIQY